MKNFGKTEQKIINALKPFAFGFSLTIDGLATFAGVSYDQAQKAVQSLRDKGTIVKARKGRYVGSAGYRNVKLRLSKATWDKLKKEATKPTTVTTGQLSVVNGSATNAN